MEHAPPPLEGPMRVLPREAQLLEIGRRLGAPSLIRVLTAVSERFRWPASGFELGRLDDAMAMAEVTAAARLPLKYALGYLGCPADLRDRRAAAQLVAWARRHAHGLAVEAPPPPPRRLDRGVAGDPADLADAERAARLLTAYLWLAQKWPGIYGAEAEARTAQARLNDHIERSLRTGASARLRKRWQGGERPG
jgi:hypothetical protein